MADYKKTLHLPRTSFPMKANLTQKEVETLKFWEKTRAYETMTQANKDGERYVLHDGPPYANGHLHLGTALNKILKDIIIKHKSMQGYLAEYVPGWDCHGLPIEHNVEQELKSKGKTDLPILTVRRICRKYAEKFVDIQRKEFKRLGVFGVWEDPYLTMRPAYEAATARELGNFMANGSVYRGKKPIYWCGSCKTALAEAEVEYADLTSPSIFVRFPLKGEGLEKVFPEADPKKTFIVIWTTTPWTLPANLAVAVHPDFEYARVRVGDEFYVLAKELLESCAEKFGWENAEITALVPGRDLEGLVARHPFYNRDSIVVVADYVTLETGTGCVHTAPGHGREDYETGLRYGLEILSPLDDTGSFFPDVEFFGGLGVFQADPKVMDKLEETGNLLAREKIRHSYPHCWRCKKPVIFRATTQWFISMEANGLREKALSSIDSEVAWVPAWGRERIHNMIATRPDWCISRQRTWGVPIIALLCEKCGEAYFDPDWVQTIVERFEAHETGCDYWFEADISEITPKDLACPKCGAKQWKKEDDILDVWFDSGTSFAAVVEQRKECRFPADMYLEGSDQHRGWFHSSLLASIGTRGEPPYRTVLTHGYVVDGQGKKMSKSVGNVVAPQEVIDKFGAEILRVWTASVDYQDDVRISDEIVRRLVDAYRRIRNTCRFILGNLNDFDPKEHATSPDETLALDRYALEIAKKTHERIQNAYDKFEFHKVFHTLHNLCVTDLSAFYLDIIKDRLYVEAKNSTKRRSAQTGLWLVLMLLLQDMAPILSFTAEEVYQHLPEAVKPPPDSVFGLRLGLDPAYLPTEERRQTFDLAKNVRSEVNKAIEPVRQSGKIGHSLDTHVTLYVSDELLGK
ncbi:MAG: isoleucine--tRNA ligase, partial [Thermodesulfobacteriota bacterium]|nr:isoleucine--tRNA ligase [Thermodesulfobacteriota bacterium]